jgi:hypothetical protein
MTKLREPGEVWHIGWDWYAHMWFVEPPFDVDLDEPIKWFNDRDEAFNFVDDWIREQPVQASIVDQAEINHEVVAVDTSTWDDDGGSIIPPRSRAEQVIEPPRVLSVPAPVHIPTPEEATTAAERRVAEYAQRVGLK